MVRVLSVRRISDRLKEADFPVERVESWGDRRSCITIAETNENELARVMAALAPGYDVDINLAEPGYEVVLTENA